MKAFLIPYISDRTIRAVCWTLIHSLWIGMIAALLAGIIITFTRKASAALRYRLLCSILVMFAISVGAVFILQVRPAAGPALYAGTNGVVITDLHYVPPTTASPVQQSLFDGFTALVGQNTDIIFAVWLLFFLYKSLKMAGGLLYIHRIRNYKIHDVAAGLQQKMTDFGVQIGIKRTVKLVRSELVKMPVAVGWLRPLVLLPVGIVLQLPPEQLESILWHELAHIRRRDYLVNILQGLVETVFFFNSGLLWLSSLIRAEREACCDDMVLSRMNRKANYLEALLAFGNGNNRFAGLAMGIGSGSQLRDRMMRMISRENKRLSVSEKLVLAIGLVVLSAFTNLPGTTRRTVQHLVHIMTEKKAIAKPESAKAVPEAQSMKQLSAMTTHDTVNRQPDTTVQFVSILFKNSDADLANNDISAMDASGRKYHFVVSGNKLAAMEVDGKSIADSELPNYEYMIRYIDREIAEKRRFIAGDWNRFKANSPAARLKWDRKGDSLPPKAFDTRLKFNDEQAKLFTDQKGPDPRYKKSKAILKRQHDDNVTYDAELTRARGVIADLVAEKVVANPSAVKWFGLSNDELIVNGQKQTDALHEKLKAKYNIHADYGLYYGPVQMTGKGVFIDEDEPRGFDRHSMEQRLLKQRQFMQADSQFKSGQQKQWSPDKDFAMQQRKFSMLAGRQKTFFKQRVPLNDIVASVTDDLINEDVVKDKSSLTSFKLTNRFLTVNGIVQPEGIHQKLRAKYLSARQYRLNEQMIGDPDFGLHYDAKTGGMGLGISVDPGDPAVK